MMSDDYSNYHLYLITGRREVLCVVLGEADSEYVIEKSEPFKLPLPTIEIIKDND